jgi:dTMP kinase
MSQQSPHTSADWDWWRTALAGRFIVFDGPDGSGKSTQIRRFLNFVQGCGLRVCHVREPGGTHVGEQIRQLLLDPETDGIDLRCEMLLYMASRAQLLAERIRPALQQGQLVLADRFISSTLAYQGSAGGLDLDEIRAVGRVAIGPTWPDLYVIFDVDERTAAARLSPLLDRMEQKSAAYHRAVRGGYHEQAQDDPQRYRLIDAAKGPDEVFDQLLHALEGWLRTEAPARG